MDQLPNFVEYRFSHPAPETPKDGHESSPSAQTSPRRSLNPRFAAWLMGWNPAWTSLAPLNCESSETGLYPNRRHMPFECWAGSND